MHRVELELTTVTPAFIGTSDSHIAEWTAKGVRGHLRWWLRAILGGELRGDAGQVRKREQALFGCNESRSAVRIMVRPVGHGGSDDVADGNTLDENELAKAWGATNPAVRARLRLRLGASNPIAYLGYGPIGYRREKKATVYERGRILPDQRLKLLLQWSEQLSGNPLDDLRKALWCWLHLGGIGGRSRRGFGSLFCSAIRTVRGEEPLVALTQSLDQFEGACGKYLELATGASATAEWSHFTTGTRVFISTSGYQTWQGALTAAGAWLIAFRRRYGLGSDEREAKRNRDYVWLNSPAPAGGIPDRAGFGLPLPFGKTADLVAAWRERGQKENRRRASPLLIHVSRFEKQYYVVLTHMPALLVPAGSEIHFNGQHMAPTAEQKGIIGELLSDLEGKEKSRIRRVL